MRTFRDVVEGVTPLPDPGGVIWPPTRRGKIPVCSEHSLKLPIDATGYAGVQHLVATEGRGADVAAATACLLTAPSFVVPLQPPNSKELSEVGWEEVPRPSHRPRALALAGAFRTPTQNVLWGVSRLLVVESGLRPGSNVFAGATVSWADDALGAEAALASLLYDVADTVVAGAEPNDKPWKQVTILLGDVESKLLAGRGKRQVVLTAGLRGVRLVLRPNPDSVRAEVIRDLRRSPPDLLLVAAGTIAAADYEGAYLRARPTGRSEVFGSFGIQSRDELLLELLMHLDGLPARDQGEPGNIRDWTEGSREILALEGPHLRLSERAKSQLVGNPYVDVTRMVGHIRKLAALAERFHASNGTMGGRLADFAILDHGIEIALKDSSLSFAEVQGFPGLYAEPHVKVDDAKTPDKCGRVYFAIDSVENRFVIDHVGLHDYGA